MRNALKIFVVLTLVMALGAGTAMAAGYERLSLEDVRPVKVHNHTSTEPQVWDAVRKASFVDKIPGLIDDAAMLVKDVLSQFGLIEKKAP